LSNRLKRCRHAPAVNQHRIDHLAAIVDGDVTQKLDVARFAIDFDDGDVRAEREREVLRFEKVSCERPGSVSGGRSFAMCARARSPESSHSTCLRSAVRAERRGRLADRNDRIRSTRSQRQRAACSSEYLPPSKETRDASAFNMCAAILSAFSFNF
jgi:hypothetical protein